MTTGAQLEGFLAYPRRLALTKGKMGRVTGIEPATSRITIRLVSLLFKPISNFNIIFLQRISAAYKSAVGRIFHAQINGLGEMKWLHCE